MKLILFALFITIAWFLMKLWNETKQTFNEVDDYSDL